MSRALKIGTSSEDWGYLGRSRILVSGRAFVADVSGALFWPAEETLIVSDLHLELQKGASLAGREAIAPTYDIRATLIRLREVMDRYHPARLITLGDSFYDAATFGQFQEDDLELIKELQERCQWIWVKGHHDPEAPDVLDGIVTECVNLAGLKFRYHPIAAPVVHEMAGYLRPIAKISSQGRTVRRRCFVSNGSRLVLPAFGEYTDGINVLDDAFAPLFSGESLFVWMVGWSDVFPIAARQLLSD